MAKRVDNDSTMELSTSQLVPDQPDNDASVWGQVVVAPEQFAPAPPAPATSNYTALWVFLGFLALAVIAGAAVVLFAD